MDFITIQDVLSSPLSWVHALLHCIYSYIIGVQNMEVSLSPLTHFPRSCRNVAGHLCCDVPGREAMRKAVNNNNNNNNNRLIDTCHS